MRSVVISNLIRSRTLYESHVDVIFLDEWQSWSSTSSEVEEEELVIYGSVRANARVHAHTHT